MPKFIITYLGGNQPESPEQGKQHFAKYQQWLASLGNAAISPMNPIKNTNIVASDGSVSADSSTKMSGYTIIESDNMDSAVAIAKACPFLELGGSLEISEMIEMKK